MKQFYRVHLAESWNDGESWSVNQYYEQPYVVCIDENSTANKIVKALKQGGLLNKYIHNTAFTLEGETGYAMYLERYYRHNTEPLIIMLTPIDKADVDRELSSTYGIQRKQTITCWA